MTQDKKTGRFTPTPAGVKTEKMLSVEKKLGRTLEEDFKEYYVEKGLGQKRLADRWGVKRNTIFSRYSRGGRRCWVEMLKLNVRGRQIKIEKISLGPKCEICQRTGIKLDGAHWVDAASGGSDKIYNRLKICPNCHRLLDIGDKLTTEESRKILLLREVKKLIENTNDEKVLRNKLLLLCKAIIERKPLEETFD